MIEGLCRKLDPDFELMKVAGKLSKEVMLQRLTPDSIAREVMSLVERTVDTAHTLPVTLANISEKLENGTIQHRIVTILNDPERKFISKMVTRTAASLIMTGTLIAGTLADKSRFPVAAAVFFLALILVASTFFKGKNG